MLSCPVRRPNIQICVDVTALSAYCSAAGHLRVADEAMRGHALNYTTKSGQQHVNPLLRIASQVQADMLRIGAQFGLTPVGRLRLSGIKPPAGPSKFESDLPLSDLPGSF